MKIPLTYKFNYLQGDRTEYMQRSIELEPIDQYVIIELEYDPKLFSHPTLDNYWKERTVWEVSGGDKPKQPDTPSPICLTPEGVKEVRKLINEALHKQHPYAENQEEDWDDEKDEVNKDEW